MNPMLKLLTKFISGLVYFFIFMGISFAIAFCAMVIITLFSHAVFDIIQYREKIAMAIFIILLIYSAWLSRDAAINLSENNCLFLEAIKISISNSRMHLSLLPFIGSIFDKKNT